MPPRNADGLSRIEPAHPEVRRFGRSARNERDRAAVRGDGHDGVAGEFGPWWRGHRESRHLQGRAPGPHQQEARDAQAVMVFGEPSRGLRAAFDEVENVDGVWLGRRR